MKHKVTLPLKNRNRGILINDLRKMGLSLGNAEQTCLQAALISEDMVNKAYAYMQKALGVRRSRWKNNFNNNALLKEWFGTVDSKSQAQKVENRMRKAKKRIKKGLTLKMRPQKEMPGTSRNHGSFASPRSFRVFPALFTHKTNGRIDPEKIAAVFIHEVMHVWFNDQMHNGTKVNEDTADDLASSNPQSARKSPENYEQFSRAVWGLP